MRTTYSSDVERERFAQRIEPMLGSASKITKPRTVDLYEVFCAVLYVLRTGCKWRMLPREFPHWNTVYYYYRKWRRPDRDGVSILQRVLDLSSPVPAI